MSSDRSSFRARVTTGALCAVAALLLSTPSPAVAAEEPPAAMAETAANDSTPAHPGVARSVPDAHRIRGFSLTAHNGDRCRYFLTTETSASRVNISTEDKLDQYIVTNGVGLMRNLDDRWAVGGALELAWARGHVMFAPALRCRRWFAGEQSLEASLAFVQGGRDVDYGGTLAQLDGPLMSLRYAPWPWLFVHGGVCRYREQQGTYRPPDYALVTTSRTYRKGFAGVGLNGAGGAALWTVELVGLGVLVILFSGMS